MARVSRFVRVHELQHARRGVGAVTALGITFSGHLVSGGNDTVVWGWSQGQALLKPGLQLL